MARCRLWSGVLCWASWEQRSRSSWRYWSKLLTASSQTPLPGQNRKTCVTPVQSEVVPPRGALNVLLDRGAAEGQVPACD